MTRRLRRAIRAIRSGPQMPRPGWYPVEDGSRERWHDNYGWSEHYRSVYQSKQS